MFVSFSLCIVWQFSYCPQQYVELVCKAVLSMAVGKFLICCAPLGELIEEGLQMLYKTVSWSLNQLTLNRYPCKDMHGNPLDRGHHGRICDCTFITCDIVGDWKWLKETFKFRH